MKVYLVTSGCYSDYYVDGIFLDKEKAEKYADVLQGHNPVEEMETMDDNLDALIHDALDTKNDAYEIGIAVNYIKYRNRFTKEIEEKIDATYQLVHKNKKIIRFNVRESDSSLSYVRPIKKYDFEKHDEIKDKAIKTAYDLYSQAMYLYEEGMSCDEIEKILFIKEGARSDLI